MPYMTPLEKELDAQLQLIGLPFCNRILIHEAVINDMVDDIHVPDYFRRLAGRPVKVTLSWDAFLVHRNTETGGRVSVVYDVFPSEGDMREMANTLYGHHEEAIDRILERRSFFTEEVMVWDEAMIRKLKQHKELGMMVDEDQDGILLFVQFRPRGIDTYIDPRLDQGMMDGIKSPVTGAVELSRRIGYLVKSYS